MAEAVIAPPRFAMRGVRKCFGATVALERVDLTVRAGEVCGLVGQNGAGKSTLMAILAGAVRPDAGDLRLDGAPFAPGSPLEARRAGIGMIYQEFSLAPHLSVMENIALGVEPVRAGFLKRADMQRVASAALAELGHPELDPRVLVGDLSPAARQLVEIARVISLGCRVLVFDEPTSSLGHADVERLFALIGRLKARGDAIVYISHFIEEVKTVSDRFVVLRDGRNVGEGITADAASSDIVALMVGESLEALYPRSPRRQGERLLDLGDLDPGHATLTLHRGEIVGIAGLVGAGRTRLLRAIFGLGPIRSGRIRLGRYEDWESPQARWRHGMGFVSEDRAGEGLALGLTVAENITLSRLESLGPPLCVAPSRQAAAASRWIEALGIRCRGPAQTIGELSGGNQQKAALARLLHHDADVFILDEPTRGIDVSSKAQIYQLLDALVSSQRGTGSAPGVLLVSSYLPELLGVCDRVAVMSRGRLGAPKPVTEWTEHGLLMAASGARLAS